MCANVLINLRLFSAKCLHISESNMALNVRAMLREVPVSHCALWAFLGHLSIPFLWSRLDRCDRVLRVIR